MIKHNDSNRDVAVQRLYMGFKIQNTVHMIRHDNIGP